MEGKDPEKGNNKQGKESSGQPQKDNGKEKLIEGLDGKPQTEEGQKNLEEEKEYYKCFICGRMCFSWRLYLLHAETDHKDHPFSDSMGKFTCYYCYGERDGKWHTANTMEEFLIHVISNHPDWSYSARHPEPSYPAIHTEVLDITESLARISVASGEDDEASESSQSVDGDEVPSDNHESESDHSGGLPSVNQECKSDDNSELPFDNQGHMSDQGSS